MRQCQLDFELYVISFVIVLERVFTISCIAILLPWSQDKSIQENHRISYLVSHSLSLMSL